MSYTVNATLKGIEFEYNSEVSVESKKIQEEIKILKRPWYKKIEYWQFFATTVIAVCTVLILYRNGIFDFRTKELEVKKENLEWDVKKFQTEKENIILAKEELLKTNNQLLKKQQESTLVLFQLDNAIKVFRDSLKKKNQFVAQVLLENQRLKQETLVLSESSKTKNSEISFLDLISSSSSGLGLTKDSKGYNLLNTDLTNLSNTQTSRNPDLVFASLGKIGSGEDKIDWNSLKINDTQTAYPSGLGDYYYDSTTGFFKRKMNYDFSPPLLVNKKD